MFLLAKEMSRIECKGGAIGSDSGINGSTAFLWNGA
jgi:hypothetical protein